LHYQYLFCIIIVHYHLMKFLTNTPITMKTKNILQGCVIAAVLFSLTINSTYVNGQSGQKWAVGLNSISSGDGIGTSNNFPMVFHTDNIPWMWLTTSGSLGLGVSNPFHRFEVQGNSRFLGSAFVDSLLTALEVQTGGLTTGSLLVTGNSQFNGLVNIGSTLILDGANSSISSTTGTVDFLNSNITTTGSINASQYLINGSPFSITSPWVISGDPINDPIHRIGRVGIGTQSPSAKLHIKGIDATNNNFALKVTNNTGVTTLFDVRNDGRVGMGDIINSTRLTIKGLGNDANTFALIVRNSDNEELFSISDDGDIGIGTIAPGTSSLTLKETKKIIFDNTIEQISDIRWLQSGVFKAAIQYNNNVVEKFDFFVGGGGGPTGLKLTINENGDVGIGTGQSVPSARLHIKGVNNLSDNFGLKVQDNVGTEMFNVRNDGLITVGGRIDQIGLGNSTYFGKEAGLNDDLTSNLNVGVGFEALLTNITGIQNVAIGYQALRANTTSFNTAIGYKALFSNVGGQQNTAIGLQALEDNISGSTNTAIGSGALANNTIATSNTAIGKQALSLMTTGGNNTAIGDEALKNNILGGSNVAVGKSALEFSTSSFNTAIGQSALLNSTGQKNIALGQLAGDNITTGQRNIIIGQDVDAPSATTNEQLNIGNLIFGTGLNGIGTTISTGNIGIGINNPSARFHVEGIDATSSNFALKVQDNVGTDLFDVRNDGKITINTTTAANRGILQIKGDADATIATFFTSTGGRAFDFLASGDAGIFNIRDVSGNTDVTLSTTGQSLITNGLLIGDGIVQHPLQVRSEANNRGIRVLDNTGTKFVAQLGGVSEDGLFKLFSSEVEKIHISANGTSFFDGGDIGIGLNTGISARFHVKGKDATSSNFAFKVQDDVGTPLLNVRNDGNVGIGTETPQVMLDVAGDIRASGSISANGLIVSGETTFDSLQVQNKITVGAGTLILEDDPDPLLGITNSIYTTDDALFLQSNPGNSFNTIINAGNELDPGLLGVGTDDPQKMLHVLTVHDISGPLPPIKGSHHGIRLEDHTISDLGTNITIWDLEPKGGNLIMGTPDDPVMTLTSNDDIILHGLADLTPPLVQFRPVVVDPVGQLTVLPSNASGPFVSWKIEGNETIDDNVNFMGPTNGADLVIKTGDKSAGELAERMRIKSSGNVGIGTDNPQKVLHIKTSHDLRGHFGPFIPCWLQTPPTCPLPPEEKEKIE